MIKSLQNIFIKLASKRKLVLAVNIAPWKRDFFKKIYRNYAIVFVPLNSDIFSYQKYLKKFEETVIVVWGYRECHNLKEFAIENNLKITRIEDGFVRGKGLGIEHNLPYSLCFDSQCLYFDAREESNFEKLALKHQSIITDKLLEKSRYYVQIFKERGITKYLLPETFKVEYPEKPSSIERILVIGQSEGDASIRFSLSAIKTNFELVTEVRNRHPDAQIVYKQHPDETFRGTPQTKFKEKCNLFIDFPTDYESLMEGVDKVYTISSLLGFELLIRGARVHVFGMPFYAGWGLTEDEQSLPRRNVKLSIEELFALTYILYPKYFDKDYNEIEFDAFIKNYLSQEELLYQKTKHHDTKHPQISDLCQYSQKNLIDNGAKRKSLQTKAKLIPENTDQHEFELIPVWLQKRPSMDLLFALNSSKPVYVYLPWIYNHTDILMSDIQSDKYHLVPLNLARDFDSEERMQLSKFSRQNPVAYRRYIHSRLVPLKGKICGLIVTFDWAPISRIAVEAANELDIPTFLIPHEFVFINSDLYYRHPLTFASVPIAREAILTCPIQKDIFQHRGYQSKRITVGGNPKLDSAASYQAILTRRQFCSIYGLDHSLPIVLFACQNLDIQIDTKAAQKAQNQTLCDLIRFTELLNFQLIIRQPPSGRRTIFDSTVRLIESSPLCTVDEAPLYLVPPREAIYHSKVVVSMNSTMLFEAVLMKRCSLSARYINGINSIWRQELIPICTNVNELFTNLMTFLSGKHILDEKALSELERLKKIFGVTGRGADTIRSILEKRIESPTEIQVLNPTREYYKGTRLDVLRIPSSAESFNTTQKYLRQLLNCNTLLGKEVSSEEELSAVQVFVQWGIAPNNEKEKQRKLAQKLGRSVVYVEDGFVRSIDIGLSGTPGLSVIRDDLTVYYDATRVSRLEKILTGVTEYSNKEQTEARSLIEKIVRLRISKYNSGKIEKFNTPSKRKKLLLIDQRFGDWSVIKGLGSESTFERMFKDALELSNTYDIIIKQHPDALKGGKTSYFSNEMIEGFQSELNPEANVLIVNEDINPYCLLESVDEVFVCSSSMGFEALMAGVNVTCYGMPWYAGYGLTKDIIRIERRKRQRCLEDLFITAYLKLSSYYNPVTGKRCNLDELLDYIADVRNSNQVKINI